MFRVSWFIDLSYCGEGDILRFLKFPKRFDMVVKIDSNQQMIKGSFLNSSQREELERIVRSPSVDHGIARRANAILLLDDGESCARIAKCLYLDDDTVRQWYKRFESGGFDELATFGRKGSTGHLSRTREEALGAWPEQRLCCDTNEIRDHIHRVHHVDYTRIP